MLQALEYKSVEALVEDVVPGSIHFRDTLALPAPLAEADFLDRLKSTLSKNQVHRSFLGMGYSDTHTPGVILRNIIICDSDSSYNMTLIRIIIFPDRLRAPIHCEKIV